MGLPTHHSQLLSVLGSSQPAGSPPPHMLSRTKSTVPAAVLQITATIVNVCYTVVMGLILINLLEET